MASAHKIEAHANAHGKGSSYSLQPRSVGTWVDAKQIVDEVFTTCINAIVSGSYGLLVCYSLESVLMLKKLIYRSKIPYRKK